MKLYTELNWREKMTFVAIASLKTNSNNSANQFRAAREILGWSKTSPPHIIISEDQVFTKPQQMAEKMNNEYVKRNSLKSQQQKNIDIDPIQHFQKVIKTPTKK